MNNQTIHTVIGLGFGDESKGSTTNYLVNKHSASLVVRYSSGPQAGHRVVTENNKAHIFSQFGSGTLSDANTFLSRYMLVNPTNLLNEAETLADLGYPSLDKNYISENCKIITPYHVSGNRLEEWERNDKHGSCGQGIGNFMSDNLMFSEDTIYAKELSDEKLVIEKLEATRLRKIERHIKYLRKKLFTKDIFTNPKCQDAKIRFIPEYIQREYDLIQNDQLSKIIAKDYAYFARQLTIVPDSFLGDYLHTGESVVFEGAQGVLLDENYGYGTPNHVTWATTTCKNVDSLLLEADCKVYNRKVCVTRAYSSRHGVGPFPSENSDLNILPPCPTNPTNVWQDHFRRGYLDLVALKYALGVVGHIDEIHMSHLDELNMLPNKKAVMSYNCDNDVFAPNQKTIQFETKQLFDSKPLTSFVTTNSDNFISFIEDELNALITVLGYGVKASDRIKRQ